MTRHSEAGFTLIEALVAFAIAAIMLSAIYDIFATSLRAATTSTHFGNAVLLAESAIDSLSNTPLTPHEINDVSGDFERSITIRARPDLSVPGSQLGLQPYQIDVQIGWHDGGRARSYHLTTLRLSP